MATIVKLNIGDDKELDAGSNVSANAIPVVFASDQLISISDDDEEFINTIPINQSGSYIQGPNVTHTHGFLICATPDSSQPYCCVHGKSGSGIGFDYNNRLYLSVSTLQKVDFYTLTGNAVVSWQKL